LHSNKFLNPVHDGAVLPILHLNGYKIANPTVLGRIEGEELRSLLVGYGHEPFFVEGDDPRDMHRKMAATVDAALDRIAEIQHAARQSGTVEQRPSWPMIVLRSPKGWTGPKEVDGKKVEGSWRAHQVPITDPRDDPGHLKLLEDWMRSYRPEELFEETGALRSELRSLAPAGARRMGANAHANGGLLKRELQLPDFRDFAVAVPQPGGTLAEATRVMGTFLEEAVRLNADARNFRIMGPDETASNRLDAVFEATERVWM
jgi:xylulose-5-phosphate/fructose-6-phosphate phosphoketolase